MKHIFACLSCSVILTGCYSTEPSGYNPYAGVSSYRSPPPKSQPKRPTQSTRSQAGVSASSYNNNYHGNHVTPPPAAPTNYPTRTASSSGSSKWGDPGKPFQFPKFEVEPPDPSCGYPRTDCVVDQRTLPGGVIKPGSGSSGTGKVIRQ